MMVMTVTTFEILNAEMDKVSLVSSFIDGKKFDEMGKPIISPGRYSEPVLLSWDFGTSDSQNSWCSMSVELKPVQVPHLKTKRSQPSNITTN